MESGTLDYAVLGVGLNTYLPKDGFPDEIKDIAGSAFEKKSEDLRNRFIGCFLNSFMGYYSTIEGKSHCAEYSRRCFVVGKKIYVVSNEVKTPAKVLGVDENCGLLVEYENGEKAILNSGEISIRLD
jgi:BirA family biotin operon repressor/biotin-[acetyl-CoA-carboxylase] ligase